MRRATALAAVGLVLAAIGPSALAAGSLPKLATGAAPGEGPRYAVRPHTIDFTGDGTGFIGRIGNDIYPVVGKRPGFLHWKTWTRERAVGVGTLWGKSCIPDCASSPYYRYAVTVTATRPRNGRFSTMTLHYRYHGQAVTDVRCDSGYGSFDVPPGYPRHKDCLARP